MTNLKENSIGHNMKVLIACEESQAVCIEFRKLGIEAYSCDIQPCSGGYPERHIQGDALEEAYSGKYDLMIAHPPCTYLSNAGARRLFKDGKLNEERYSKGLEAKEFFLKLMNSPIKYIAIENPIHSKIYDLPKYTQTIQPYEHGHPFTKKTCLRLKNLPKIIPTDVVEIQHLGYFQSGKRKGKPIDWCSYNHGSKDRSKTFPGIAKAIAQQRSEHITKSEK